MNSKLLTISIAAYNVEKYLEKAILSCLNPKTVEKIEILIIDDGSKDDTVKIAKKFQTLYPKSIRVIRKENGGYGSTINLAIQLANGVYFKLLDGDDWFDTEGLESHLKDLETHDVDMALTPNIKFIESKDKRILRDNAPYMEAGEYSIENVDIPKNINMHSITYRTELLKNTNLKITEHCFYTDAEYVVYPLQFIRQIYVSHVPVYCYRIGIDDQSMGYKGIREHFDDHSKVLKHIFECYQKIENKESPAAKWIYYRLITEVANHYHYICRLKMSTSSFNLLKDFDREIKVNNKIYVDSGEYSKFVYFLRKSYFLLYPLCYQIEKRNS